MRRTAHEVATGLRTLADWLDDHPEVEPYLPDYDHVLAFYPGTPEKFADAARAMAPCEKDFRPTRANANLVRTFGAGVKLCAAISREKVCHRVVVGTEHIDVLEPEGDDPRPLVTRRVTREIVEWECDPVLAGDLS